MTNKNAIETSKNDPILKLIGEKVKKLRKSNPEFANYEVFAFKNAINKVTLLKIEKGENHNITSLIKVINALNITIEEFFMGIK